MSDSPQSSSPAESTEAIAGDVVHIPANIITSQDIKDEALFVLKSDVMDELNKEVKAMDEDNWMFEGPRSRIHLKHVNSKPGDRLLQNLNLPKSLNIPLPK